VGEEIFVAFKAKIRQKWILVDAGKWCGLGGEARFGLKRRGLRKGCSKTTQCNQS
jgi:hypothetical protein